MRTFIGSLFAAALLSAFNPAYADDAGRVGLTIYSTAAPGAIPAELYQPAMAGSRRAVVPGYAFVRQERDIHLEGGESVLRFTDVAALIEPTTVMFHSLTDPQGATVLEQNFEFDLVSPEKLLDRFIDREVSLTYDRQGGRVDTISGTLLSQSGSNLILSVDDPVSPIRILPRSGASIGLSELPGGLITRPTLVWKLKTAKPGDHTVRVTYQTNGMTWWADYNLLLTEDADANRGKVDVSAWVSIINQSGATYPDARLKLIAGDVERAPTMKEMQLGRPVARAAMADAAQFEEKAFFEYHLYTLGRPTTLPDNSTKQIELFPAAREVPVEKLYVYTGSAVDWPYGDAPFTDRDLGTQSNTKVDIFLRLVNDDASGMGMPLPSGRVRVNKLDPADQSLEFIGESVIDHTPRNERVLIKLGSAFDVVGERRQTSLKVDTARKRIDESFEIRVRNRKTAPVRVLVQERLFRWAGWTIVESSHPYEKQDARTVHFPIDVPADEEVVVTYSVRYEW